MKRNTAILVGIALICGLGVAIVELGPQRVRQQQEEQDRQLLTLVADDVDGVDIQEGNLSVSMVKDGSGRWQLLQPVEAPAEAIVVQSIVTTLTSAEAPAIAETTIDETPNGNPSNETPSGGGQPSENLDAFGLSTPQQTIILSHDDGTSTVRVGGLTFDDSGQYLQVDDGPIRVLDVSLSSQLSTSLFALRDKRLVDWLPEDLQALTIISPDETVELENQEGNWQLSDRPEVLLSDEDVADTLSQTQYLQASQFITETKDDLATYGLESPFLQLEATLTDGSTQTISIGEPLPGTPTARHAMSSERSGVMAIEASNLDPIALTELALRDRSLGTISSALIGEITIASAGLSQDITLSPSTAPDTTADQWEISGQVDRTVAIEEFLIPLQNARATGFLAADDSTASSLLESSSITIQIAPIDGVANEPLILEFAPGDDVLYVRTSHIPDEILTFERQFYELLNAAIGTLQPAS